MHVIYGILCNILIIGNMILLKLFKKQACMTIYINCNNALTLRHIWQLIRYMLYVVSNLYSMLTPPVPPHTTFIPLPIPPISKDVEELQPLCIHFSCRRMRGGGKVGSTAVLCVARASTRAIARS